MPNNGNSVAKDAIRAIVKESDRGCVLVCAAWIEDLMRTIIRDEIDFAQKFRFLNSAPGEKQVPDKEFDSLARTLVNGALNRAANRVAYCRAIGLIDERLAAGMNALFSLRNEFFAHFAGVSRLNDRRVSQRLKEFKTINHQGDSSFSMNLSRKSYSKARCDFMNAFSVLVLNLFDIMTRNSKWHASEYDRVGRTLRRKSRELNKKSADTRRRTAAMRRKIARLKGQSQKSPVRTSHAQTINTAKRASSHNNGQASRKSPRT
jgi:hypothetical protein